MGYMLFQCLELTSVWLVLCISLSHFEEFVLFLIWYSLLGGFLIFILDLENLSKVKDFLLTEGCEIVHDDKNKENES